MAYPATQAQPTPLMLEAAHQFASWVREKAPGSIVMLCGGLAFAQYGNRRTTTDADLCMDLSHAVRAGTTYSVNTNALKDIAAGDPRLVVGPKIYWRHVPSGQLVQVDFVDANLFWQPFNVQQMVDTTLPVPSLNPPTLLVGKLKSAIERQHPYQSMRVTKQSYDVWDFDFAVNLCLSRGTFLTGHHLAHLGASDEEICEAIRTFSGLRKNTLAPQGLEYTPAWTVAWNTLVMRSNLLNASALMRAAVAA